MTVPHIVVIGYGPVGARFVEDFLPTVKAGLARVTVIGAEIHDPYNRVLVAEYAVGHANYESLFISDREAAEAAGVVIQTGISVNRIDRDEKSVHLSSGMFLKYDRLILATGARANTPTLSGVPRPKRDKAGLLAIAELDRINDDVLPAGIRALRDIADAEVIKAAVMKKQKIVVLGAGVLGLEFALAARLAGAEVCVVHHGPIPMPRNLDRGSGSILGAALRESGIDVAAHSRAEAVRFHTNPDGSERFDCLITADGKRLFGDLLVLSCGVAARDELATLAGLTTAVGIVVGANLKSWDDASIYAIGDCAHIVADNETNRGLKRLPGMPAGLIGPGWRQAGWLAKSLHDEFSSGTMELECPPEREALVMLKAESIDVVAVGDISADPWESDPYDDPEAPRRVAMWADPESGRYAKMVTRNGVLTAFACVGMPKTAAELTVLYERGSELPADRSILLRFDGPDYASAASTIDEFAPDATVCLCNGVTVAHVEDSINEGNNTIECIGKATRAGTGCGGCKGKISELLKRSEVPVLN